jgi:3-deoxy-D-manno-octulosonic-acid transferase
MLFAYSILLTAGILVLLPAFLLDAARHGKYVAGLRERAGGVAAVAAGGRAVVWLHCVSVGEAQAARPLVAMLRERFPDLAVAVSTTTLTGQRVAREAFGAEAAAVFYFPFDWAWSVRRTLSAVRPSAVLLFETELWPRFLRECRARNVPVAVVNGRISEKSFRRYARLGPLIRRVLNDLTLAVMQTEEDAARVRLLGLSAERVRVSGNVKFDLELPATQPPATAELRERFGFDDSRPLVVAASTHAPEEEIVIDALRKARAELPGTQPRLLIAPRHPERFADVASLLDSSGLTWSRRSAAPAATDSECDAVLLDTIGELRAVYPLASVVFVGGSIARTGGHNVLEPAAEAKCVVTGPHTFNFKEIVRRFRELDALVQLPEVPEGRAAGELARVLTELLADDARRRELGERARAALERNRGATERTVDILAPLLGTERGNRPSHAPSVSPPRI